MIARTTCLLLLLTSTALAGDWPQFRGPLFNGTSDETNLPESWSKTDGVVWTADLPGSGAGTPAIWQNHVFVTSSNPTDDTLLALCFDRQTGKKLWSHEIDQGIRRDSRSNFAAPSPATDGQSVVFFYGNGELISFDFAGNRNWRRNLQDDYGEFAFQWTFSTSPLLYDGKLYMQVLQRDVPARGRGRRGGGKIKSYILAIDPATGKTLWQHFRPSEAVAESLEAFSTPVPFEFNGRKELLVVGGDDITGHDPETGRELWRWGTWNPGRIGHWRLVPSPSAGGGVILACAPKKSPIYAVKAGGKGQLDDSALAWVSNDRPDVSSDVPTPAFMDGDFFVLNDGRSTLSRVVPQSGNVKWTAKLPRNAKYEASPTIADGKVYVINFLGTVVVVDANTGRIISEISMDEPSDDDPVRSTIAVAHGQLFIRTTTKLYCVGK